MNRELYLVGVTCTYNEAEMVPYVMPYVERMGYDKFIVYDNESTDNTVELLKQYPFVEVRTYKTNGSFNDDYRTLKILSTLQEYHQLSHKNDKIYCFVNVDFDEVLFGTARHTTPFKNWIRNRYIFAQENYFCDTMIDLFPKERNVDSEYYKNVRYPHLAEGMRCAYWASYGDKTTLIILNDFETIQITPGNHLIFLKPKEGKKLKNIKYSNELWGFHLKYINKSVIQKKHLNISKRYNKASNESYANDIDDIYDSLYTVSFPLSNFFEKIQLNRDSEESKLSGVFRFEDGQRIKE